MAERILVASHNAEGAESTRSAAIVAHQLAGVGDFEVPTWEALSDGLRPHEPEDHEPGDVKHGWQHEAASRVERQFLERNLMVRLTAPEQALMRSQSGPYAGMALSVAPANFLTHIDPALFRVLLLRRLRLPLPLSSRLCRCGRPWILLATTAQPVREQGCWVDGDSRSRVQQPEFAGRLEVA